MKTMFRYSLHLKQIIAIINKILKYQLKHYKKKVFRVHKTFWKKIVSNIFYISRECNVSVRMCVRACVSKLVVWTYESPEARLTSHFIPVYFL